MNDIVIKAHYDAETLARMGLPGLPKTRAAIFKRAKADGWAFVEVPGKGGQGGVRREYLPPVAVMDAIRDKAAQTLLSVAAPEKRIATERQLPLVPTTSQALVADARQGTLMALQTLMNRSGYAMKKAARVMLEMASSGEAEPQLIAMLKMARDGRGRPSESGLPSIRTLIRFVEYGKSGTLAPRHANPDMRVPAWAPTFMECYQKPEKPTAEHAYRAFATLAQERGFDTLPSLHQVRRFLGKVGKVSLQVGRMGDRELKSIKGFIRRDFADLLPTDIYSADGHAFDAEVQHPMHGRPFRPEITSVIDIATRRVVGWSVDLAESALAVLDALRGAACHGGIPAILYVDNGSGYKNQMMTDQATGLMARMGIEMVNSLPYNSQARGVIERLHKTLWVEAAKQLPGYMGSDMDRQARQGVHKLTRKAIAAAGTGEAVAMPLIGWPGFLDFCNEKVGAYNARPHRSLPKTVDPETGKSRHMTPDEAWAKAVEKGFKPNLVAESEAAQLFRPQLLRTISRCEINLFGNRYYSKYLEEFHGEQLRVGYEIHDPQRVWVYDAEGRQICTAELNGNTQPYMPKSVVERARDQRAAGRERRLENKLEEVRAERRGTPALEHMESVTIPGLFTKISRDQLQARARDAVLVNASPVQEVEVRAPMADAAPIQTGWSIPTEPQGRWDAWKAMEQMREEEIEDELQKKWRQTYQSTAEFRAYQRKTA